jgi:SAM-dependent methyltransferase
MSYYDNFAERSNPTKIGLKFVTMQNLFFINKIKQLIGRRGKIKVLEIGPDKGYFGVACKKQGFEYVGIEANRALFTYLKNKSLNVFHGKVPPISVKGKFDVIFMDQVLEHFSERFSVLSFFEECSKKLNSGGLLVISVPDIRYSKCDFFGTDYTHSMPFSIYSLSQLFYDYGFVVKYSNIHSLIFRGTLISRMIWFFTKILWSIGIISILFGKKGYFIRNLTNASCVVMGLKK